MADEMQVSLPEGVIKPIIQAQVVAALKGSEHLITEMVRLVVDQKHRDTRTYKDYPFIEWVCREQLAKAIEEAVREWVVGNTDAIRDEVARQLRSPARVKRIATELVSAMADSARQTWHLKVNVALGDKE